MGNCLIELIEIHITNNLTVRHAKKVVSDSLWLVDFAIRLVNSVLNLPNGKVLFFE